MRSETRREASECLARQGNAHHDDDGAPKTGRRFYYLALSHGYIKVDMSDTEAGKKSRDQACDRAVVGFEIDKSRVESVGRGWEEPTGSTDPAQNRRVEVQWFTIE